MDRQSMSNQALVLKKKSDTSAATELQTVSQPISKNVTLMAGDNTLQNKEKKAAVMRPLSINQVQRIVGRDTADNNSLFEAINLHQMHPHTS